MRAVTPIRECLLRKLKMEQWKQYVFLLGLGMKLNYQDGAESKSVHFYSHRDWIGKTIKLLIVICKQEACVKEWKFQRKSGAWLAVLTIYIIRLLIAVSQLQAPINQPSNKFNISYLYVPLLFLTLINIPSNIIHSFSCNKIIWKFEPISIRII